MNVPPVIKKIFQKFQFLHSICLTQTTILIYGMAILVVFVIAILAWDTYLFMRSIAPIQPVTVQESKRSSLTSQDIDEAIRIIDQRQQRFTNLLQEMTSTTTISF